MRVQLRILRSLYEVMQADLRRPHPHAGERVGFLYGRLAQAESDHPILLMREYVPLDDDRYDDDPSVGARINSAAIRSSMQAVLDRDEGVFHTHLHDWPGRPTFSFTDRAELPKMVKSFQTVGPSHAHGLFLLSSDQAYAHVWLPNRQVPVVPRITIVGFPMTIMESNNG